MPFALPPANPPDGTRAPRDEWPVRARLALELGKVVLGQVIAWALRRWWA
jgi:hypothetical protein